MWAAQPVSGDGHWQSPSGEFKCLCHGELDGNDARVLPRPPNVALSGAPPVSHKCKQNGDRRVRSSRVSVAEIEM